MDRQTIIFIIIMFILFSTPNSADEPHSAKQREVLMEYKDSLKLERPFLLNNTYEQGYGNVTGYQLSYQDHLDGKNASDWPIHEFNSDNPWREDQNFSIIPNKVRDAVKSFWSPKTLGKESNEEESSHNDNAYLFNISGRVWGEFENKADEYNLHKMDLQLPPYLQDYVKEMSQYKQSGEDEDYAPDEPGNLNGPHFHAPDGKEGPNKLFNVTYPEGLILLDIKSQDYLYKRLSPKDHLFVKVENAVIVLIGVFIKDYDQKLHHVGYLDGVYFQDTGSLLMASTSAKFMTAFTHPHLVIDQSKFETAQNIAKTPIKQRFYGDFNMEDLNTEVSLAVETCELVGYFQLEKSNFTADELRDIDEELMNPTGRPITKDIPQIQILDFLIYSPDCGIVLEQKKSKPFEGPLQVTFNLGVKHFLEFSVLIIVAQLTLFVRQMKKVKTPGQLSNISSTTISLLLYQDALIVLLTLFAANMYNGLYLLPVCLSIFAFINVVFEMRFLVNVSSNQVNENGISWWELLRSSAARTPELETTGTDGTNGANSATGTAEIPTNAPTQNDLDPQTNEARLTNSVFVRVLIISMGSLFVILNIVESGKAARAILEWIGFPLINSYWIFQFMRNTLRNRKNAFLWEFMILTSVVRLLPVFYLFARENVLRHRYCPSLALSVTVWVTIQLGLIWFQNIFGPRFWVNDKWLPKAYDYHPLLNTSDLENGFSSDILANIREMEANEDSLIVECKVDCAICMTDVEFPVQTKASVKDSTLSAIDKAKIQQCMITPCHHIFHSECLEDWMKYKLQCPVCRNALPPV